MISTLAGTVSEYLGEVVVIEVAGVGYGVNVTAEDFGHLNSGTAAKLYIYEHIREQAHDLFGFVKLDTKTLFEQLLGVNGVGPKMALSVLSIGTTEQVRQAIAGADAKLIQRANGVGKRVAERIVVDLKDKVGGLASAGESLPALAANQDEALDALLALGYSLSDAQRALQTVDPDLSTQERIKRALASAA